MYSTNRHIQGGGKILLPKHTHFAMVKIGKPTSPLHNNTGVYVMNNGTIRIFGNCTIGNDCRIVVGVNGYLSLGDGFQVTAGLKLQCMHQIDIGKNVLIGWDCYIIDTNNHHLCYDGDDNNYEDYGPIRIEDGCWLSFGVVVLKNTVIPEQCVVAAKTLVNKPMNCGKRSMIAGCPPRVVKEGVYLNLNNHIINYCKDDIQINKINEGI